MKDKTVWQDFDEHHKSINPNYLHYWLGKRGIGFNWRGDVRWVNCWGRNLGNVEMHARDNFDQEGRVSKIIGDE